MTQGNCDLCNRWDSNLHEGACPACNQTYFDDVADARKRLQTAVTRPDTTMGELMHLAELARMTLTVSFDDD